ncbi:hypothetical protein RCL_jg24047.t1 [Rhizophagus clarus]|uniref:Uncharacterized protein n=1 Tax=Rhizophagus clarus TaxID=94130 RepID=A0A8H3LMU9_9GLOM|nr:hypothetical protein RCL_jg24047.t1 [Rhizophagus clarus]
MYVLYIRNSDSWQSIYCICGRSRVPIILVSGLIVSIAPNLVEFGANKIYIYIYIHDVFIIIYRPMIFPNEIEFPPPFSISKEKNDRFTNFNTISNC